MTAGGARQLRGRALLEALADARAATFAAALDLDDAQWRVPLHPAIQPTAWDLAHVAWFAEFWLLRGPHGVATDGNVTAAHARAIVGLDEHYDSARIEHRARWEMPLLPRAELLERMQRQLDACKDAVAAAADDARGDDVRYHARFSVYHELMHREALWWTRALLAYPAPPGAAMRTFAERGEIAIDGGRRAIGVADDAGFAFDNERPGRSVDLAPFRIDRAPVRNGDFLAFVEADGYRRREFWPGRAGAWLQKAGRAHPERWRRRGDGGFEHRWFAEWRPLPLDEPVVHVSAYEAEAYCAFAGRRLPRAAEWEVASDRIAWGHSVWEWTSEPFAPYPGFRPGPYTTYSAPWFHGQRELRGGAYATHALVHDKRYRNFFMPGRTDVFAGFRTAADA